jgi:hypothetical protein
VYGVLGVIGMGKNTVRARDATTKEINERLRGATDYLAAMMQHEKKASDAAREAAQSKNFEAQEEAARLFSWDFGAFLSAARTAWNYLNQAADVAGCRDWLDERLKSNLFKFHRDLANQDTHKYGVTFGVRQTVNYKADVGTPIIQTQFGPLPAKMTVTGFVNMAYQYNPDHLEPDVAILCRSVLGKYPNETVVELALRYLEGLKQVFRSAEYRGRFKGSDTDNAATAS